ncbi:MAG: alginate O-acetyltransferase complex protein AlgI [Myxococcota bacterium]|jgi:alginate O-acetyltransferase complex protein AlgI
MLFSSPIFLIFFLPVVLVVAFALRRTAWQNVFLLLASLFFYAWGELGYTLILLGSMGFNYAFGLLVDRAAGQGTKGWLLAAAMTLNLFVLAGFKYANFIVDNLNVLLAPMGYGGFAIDPVHLPIGISFFTFQAMTYVVDIYRGDAPVERNPLRVGLYIALFPQLIAGPIVRYRTVAAQLVERHVDVVDVAIGVRRFVVGLGKKVLIADQLAVAADKIFALPMASQSPAVAWLGVTCFGLQVFFDFSGYSDMAIGIGRMLGFHFPENFNAPYVSRSLQEFWRRWHITLSGWFRDYLYIPLTSGHTGAARGYGSLFVVFFLCGLWHGANWNFVVWGLVHGAFVGLERTAFGGLISRAPHFVARAYTLLVVWVAFVFFRADSLPHALDYLAAMFGNSGAASGAYPVAMFLELEVLIWLAVGALFSGAWMPKARRRLEASLGSAVFGVARVATVLAVFVASAIVMIAGTNSPFVYFRF